MTSSSEFLAVLGRTREYIDYLAEHYAAVQRAWQVVQRHCADMRFVSDDYVWGSIDGEVREHDRSKLSEEEFVAYRRMYFPTAREEAEEGPAINRAFDRACQAHLMGNPHHWQTWTTRPQGNPYWVEVQCVHMVLDWMAMGEAHGNTARDYYDAIRDQIRLPGWADLFVNEIFERVYGPSAMADLADEETR